LREEDEEDRFLAVIIAENGYGMGWTNPSFPTPDLVLNRSDLLNGTPFLAELDRSVSNFGL
jgi:hypothetical protein